MTNQLIITTKLSRSFLVLCVALLCGILFSPVLSAQWVQYTPSSDYFFIVNVGNNKVVDVARSSTKVATNVGLWGRHGGKNQQFRFVAQGNGYYAIETALKQKIYLSAHNSGTADNTNLKLNNPVGKNQHFRVEKNSRGTYRFISRLGSGLYLGANDSGDNIVLRRGDKGKKIYFQLIPSRTSTSSTPATATATLPKSTDRSRYSLNIFNAGWTAAKHLRTAGDLNGDGYIDLVGFGQQEVFVGSNDKNMVFTLATLKGLNSEFTGANGWKTDLHHRQVIDVNNDGKADLVGFGNNGLMVATNQGNLQFRVKRATTSFSNNSGWTGKKHVRMLADINGDNIPDIVGFGSAKTFISFGERNGQYGSKKTSYTGFSYDSGWRTDVHERTVADINNDGKLDLVGFGGPGVYVAYGDGAGGFGKAVLALKDFGREQGYRTSLHKRTTGDINGDGKTDLIAFAGNFTKIAFGLGGGRFGPVVDATKVFSIADSWSASKDHRFVADMNKDGKTDLVGFNWNGAAILLSKSASTQASFKSYFPKEHLAPSNWMANIKDEVSLKDLTIPGTHDSGADYGCPDFSYSKYAVCQDWTITEQLNKGIRYLDIRLKYNSDEGQLRIQHGKCYQRDNFGSVLKEIKNFLLTNPTEAIIMRFKDEDDDTKDSVFKARFDEYIADFRNIIFTGETIPTLREARGKVVLIDFCTKMKAYVPHGNLILPRGNWYNDGDEEARYTSNWAQMVTCREEQSPRQKLYFSAFNQNGLSEGADDLIAGFFTAASTPRDIAEYMTPKLKKSLSKSGNRRGTYGMVVMDFPTEHNIQLLIKSNNSPDKLK